jgi:DNA-binding NarL/FixJ family response regulator
MTGAELERAAAKAALARMKLEKAILEAQAEGASLRDIAQAVGLSHETVRRICAK